MALIHITSPHSRGQNQTASLMLWVILATLPGLAAQTYFFGWGNLINVVLASLLAVLSEALILKLRKRPVMFYLSDYSAVVTGVLLGLALPPLVPWWVTLVAVAFAIIIAKQLYGGLGFNPFNPAMVGYALVLVSFPVAMTTNWATPVGIPHPDMSITDTLARIFGFGHSVIDGITSATPLDVYKHEALGHTAREITKNPVFGNWFARGWEWVNLGFLAGGLFLLYKKVFTWHAPFGVLAGITLCSMIFGWDADLHAPAILHLLAGGTMLGAFFIATDPVTSAVSRKGRLIYGLGIGILIYVIRTWGSYPDAVAFSVLLMNFAAPFIDFYTQPRTYGHIKAKSRVEESESR
jgi:electron transport complex protein RnfD